MIGFIKEQDTLYLHYSPEYGEERVDAKLGIGFSEDGKLIEYEMDSLPTEIRNLRGTLNIDFFLAVKRTFFFSRADLDKERAEEGSYYFKIGFLNDSYYKIDGRIFDIRQEVALHESIKIDCKLFCTGYRSRTSIFRKISKLIDSDELAIIIGGENENAIPEEEFRSLIANFPNTYELERIADARIAGYIQDYLETNKDYIAVYEKYSKRKRNKIVQKQTLSSDLLNPSRLESLHLAHSQLSGMIKDGEKIDEEEWQQGILKLLPVLFPQYIDVLPKVKISDKVNPETEFREIDFLLVDASGNIDVLEIKKGFNKNSLIRKKEYRGNFIPAKELTGGIMQIEKYIYYLLNWAQDGEKELTQRYANRLSDGLALRFLNPKGLLIMGCCDFDHKEQRDFDLIRRKYSKIVDIITYNDFTKRLERMIDSLEISES